MAEIRPFRGIVYDAARVGDLARVVGEPYDKVTESLRAQYLARSPYHIVRVDLPREEEPGADRYRTAARLFRSWLAEGVLRRAGRPALYLYEQSFLLRGERRTRRAFVGLIEARPYARGHVLPHERTFREPKADRMALLEALRAHLGMVFLLYRDEERAALGALERAAAGAAPLAEFRLEDATEHRLVAVEDARAIAEARAALRDRTCYIADGHHRYETQVAFREAHERRGDARPGHRYRLAAFVELSDPGLAILPTHRLLPPSLGAERAAAAAARCGFRVEELGALAGDGAAAVEGALARLAAPERRPGRFLLAGADGRLWLLSLREEAGLDAALADVPEAVRRLDVAILHRLLLERELGLHPGASETAIGYAREPRDALGALAAGRAGCAIFLLPTPVEGVVAAAESGAVMPQKSTDFYPKLLTGLVMNDIEDDLHGE